MAAVEFGLLFNDSKQCSFRKRGSGITPVCASTGQLPRARTWSKQLSSNRAMAFYPQYSYLWRSSVVLCYFFILWVPQHSTLTEEVLSLQDLKSKGKSSEDPHLGRDRTQ